jgi:hypothetical protein
MPPRKRQDEADELCAEDFPNGWPEGATSVGCAHGNWARTAPKPADDKSE